MVALALRQATCTVALLHYSAGSIQLFLDVQIGNQTLVGILSLI